MSRQIDANFLPQLKVNIPLVEHMGIQSLTWHNKRLTFNLNFAPLINDKGTGFGGGLAGLATLLGWCFVTLLREEAHKPGPVVVKESFNSFKAPIQGDFQMHCEAVIANQEEEFIQQIKSDQRATLELKIWVEQQGKEAFIYQGTYVALQ